jgi:carboxypeptidase Q
VKLEFDIRAMFGDREEESFNIVGEIPGGSKKDEIVMIGGHFDSWHGATGATDNGTGSSVAIEAMRILKSLNVQMDRTVRIALWSGEEEGLLGSIAYVKNHFADRADMKTKPEYEKLVAYFNSDSGTGKFRGISVGGNDALMPIFSAWLRPFADLGATVVAGASAPPNGAPAGTDHTSFAYAGLNGFGFMQEPMEYGTRTHHSNMDFYDRVQKGDVMQSAAIMASFAYHTAMRAEALPKMAKPKAQAWVSR